MRKYTLYIFVKSDEPDVYINTITHCMEHYTVSKIYLLKFKEDESKEKEIVTYLTEVKDRVEKQIELLNDGKYLKKDDINWWTRYNAVDPEKREVYRKKVMAHYNKIKEIIPGWELIRDKYLGVEKVAFNVEPFKQ